MKRHRHTSSSRSRLRVTGAREARRAVARYAYSPTPLSARDKRLVVAELDALSEGLDYACKHYERMALEAEAFARGDEV